jgi:(p)ppGpp synthase/HD superfamily hydrolase
MDIIDKAIRFACKAHQGTTRKTRKIPSVLHPLEAGIIAMRMTDDHNTIAACILHDVVEDTPYVLEDIRREFGDRVAFLVDSETEDKMRDRPKEETWIERKKQLLSKIENTDDREVKVLWVSDKLANMRDFYRLYLVEGDKMWNHFNMKDPEVQKKYYLRVLECLSSMEDEPAYQELKAYIYTIFRLGDFRHD